MGDFVEGGDLGGRKQQAAGPVAPRRCRGLQLPGQHAGVVAVAEDVGQHGLHVACLRATLREGPAAQRLGVDHLEEERAALLLARHRAAAAERRQRAADEARHDLVDQRQAVALVIAERQQRHGLVGIGRRVAVLVHGGIRRQRLAFALQLLHAAHRDHGGCPVDHDRKAHRLGRREAPGMRVGAQRGKHALERHHLRERRGAVGVGDVALLRSLHHVAAAPEIVEGVVDRDRAAAVGVGQLHAGVDRLPGHRLAELLLGVPGLRGFEPAREPPNRSLRHAAAGLRSEQLVEV